MENNSAAKLAARNGHLDIVAKLLESTSNQSEKKMSALHLATQNDMLDVVEDLLKHPDISPDVQDSEGLTPLHWAAGKGWLSFSQLCWKLSMVVTLPLILIGPAYFFVV